jgi:signal transduction histidine kinase/ActR/RegA family two-component response regulator
MTGQTVSAPALRLLGATAPPGLHTFGLDRDVTLLGRDLACEIVLTSAEVSRRHARIERRSDGYYVEDLGSKGGTRLNDEPLSQPTRLREGDRIGIGGWTFAFTDRDIVDEPRGGNTTAILGLRDVSITDEHELAGIRPEEKLRALLEIGRDLVGTLDLKDVLEQILDALFRIFPQAERGFVVLKKEGTEGPSTRAVKVRDGPVGRITISESVFDYVLRHGQAILSADLTADNRFGGSQSVEAAQIRTLICVPLLDHHRQPFGILQLDTRDPQSRFTPEDLDILVAVAGQVSVAVEHARLLAVTQRERSRLAFLAEAGAVLATSLDLPATLAAVARLAVTQLADLCLIDLEDDDGTVRRVAAAHADPTKQELVDLLRLRFPPDPQGQHPAMRVLRTGQPELANTVLDELLEAPPRDAEHLAIVRRLGFKAYLIVPLVARGRTLGVLSLVATEAARKYGPADLELAELVALRAALAIDNATLYQAAQDALRRTEEAQRRAEEAGRSKDLFLAMLSHELRTPLTPILAAVSDRLEHGVAPELRPELEMIRRNVALESRLIDDLLDIARIERGRLRLDREVVDLHETIRQAVEICLDEIFVTGLEVRLDLSAPEHHAEGDVARLMQIVWNLIRNAAKFTLAGGSLTIRSDNLAPEVPGVSAERVVIDFEDTGQGIEPELLPRIFDAFEQGRADLQARGSGLGLGLAISRSLAEAHGGRLSASSRGRSLGATFRLELATVPAPVVAPEVAPPPPPLAPGRTLRILLVEDNQDTLQFLALILGRRGYEVYTAANLAEARAAVAAERFDLLISDIELPDGTSLGLVRELRDRRIPSIAMSGYGSEEDLRQSLEAGFVEHLTKPIDLGRLEEAMSRAVPTFDRRDAGRGVNSS